MLVKQGDNRLLSRFSSSAGLANNGVKAELVGRHSVRISRNGRFVGVWRELGGAYEWLPAGRSQPEFRAITPDDAVRHSCRTFGVPH